MLKKNNKIIFLFLIIFSLLISNKTYANQELWWCEKEIDTNMNLMIPVWVIFDEKKLIFLEEVNVDGKNESSSHGRHEFEIYDLNSQSYAFKGKWGKLNAKGVLYNNNSSYPQNTLIYTIDKIGSFEYYCDQLRIK